MDNNFGPSGQELFSTNHPGFINRIWGLAGPPPMKVKFGLFFIRELIIKTCCFNFYFFKNVGSQSERGGKGWMNC